MHEGIVSVEVWEAVQAELARRYRIGTIAECEGQVFRKKIVCGNCGWRFQHTSGSRGPTKYRAWMCGGRDKRTGVHCMNRTIPEPTLMKVTAGVLGLDEFDGEIFTERVEKIIACEDRLLTFVFHDGTQADIHWERRKTIPYSCIGAEKRIGRNICYSKCGKGNMSERRRRKLEQERLAAEQRKE